HTAPHRNTEQGLALFKGKAGCIRCHHGPSLTDGRFYNLGVDSSDPGRAAISLLEEDRGRFRTPPLVLLSKTAPYFHNGSAANLENVLQHYTEGAGEAGQIHLNPEEKQALLAFLRTL
ncbi:MAG: cytochrome-c peroxidase, partial [Bacteroidota bacterium]